jgi:hypothetical protein
MFEIPEGLDFALIPMSFLIGRWGGGGVGHGDVPFTQQIDIAVIPGRTVLSHVSTTTAEDGTVTTELGFWRPGEGVTDVEFLAVDASGFLEVCYGEVDGYRIELGSDAIIRTSTGPDVTAVRRLYGRVEGDLAYALDRAGSNGHWSSYASARLNPI